MVKESPSSDTPGAETISEAAAKPRKPKKRGRGRGSVGREAIVQSTRNLLRQVPPSSLSRKFVAESINVDPALLRYYFSDLRHLMTEVLKLLVEEYGARYEKLDIDPNKPEEAIRKRIFHLVTFIAEDPSFHDLFTEQIINGRDEWAKATRDMFTEKFYGALSDLIRIGQEQGLFRNHVDPRFVYLSIIGAAEFMSASRTIFVRLFGEETGPTDIAHDYAEYLTHTILSGLRAEPA